MVIPKHILALQIQLVYSYSHTPGEFTHTQTCAACGAAEEVDCYYSEFVVSDGQLRTRTKACACGATLTASLTNADNLIYNGTAHKPNGVAFTVDGVTPRNDVANFNTYASNKDAGTGTVAVLDAGEVFWGIFQLTFPIAKPPRWSHGMAEVHRR